MHWTVLLILLLITCSQGAEPAAGGCENVTALSGALDALLAAYERDAPPAARVLVRLTLDVRHAAVLEPSAELRMLGDLRMSWTDSRLSWNATEWGCASALVSAERLWAPDVVLLNALSSGSGGADATLRARLASDGAVTWLARLDAGVPVALRLKAWPRDEQTAVFKFASRAHTFDELELTIEEVNTSTVFESGAWEMVQLRGSTAPWAGRRVAAWSLVLRRRAAAQALAARAVLAAAALALLAAALLPPRARAPLCAAASFIAAMWLTSALLRLPAGASTPRLLALMCVLCVCGAAAGACGAAVERVARVAAPAPRWLRALLLAVPDVCQLAPPEGAAPGAWAAAARLLDRAALAALLLTVLIVGCLAV